MARASNSESEKLTLKMKPSEASQAIALMVTLNRKNAELNKKRRGLFMWGPPGVAKSSITEQVCRKINYKLIDIRLTQMEPTDLRGIPIPVGEGRSTEVIWAPPALLPRAPAGERIAEITGPGFDAVGNYDPNHVFDGAIILLDELPNAAPSVQAGSYQLVLDGQLGEYRVPDNCVVMAAGNRDTDKGATFKMPTPLLNRFVHIEVQADFDDWQAYALSDRFSSEVVGYISSFKNKLMQFDPTSASRGFPTPRSWEAVSDILRESANAPDSIIRALVAGAVGDGVAVEFMEYRKLARSMPSSASILDGKTTHLEAEVSLQYALTAALCYELKDRHDSYDRNKKDAEKAKLYNTSVNNFLGFIMKNYKKEMAVMAARTALKIYKLRINTNEVSNWSAFSDKFADLVLRA